ncbi:MAG: hypothetical protein ACK6A9_21760, partial [Dolichospermum sp.]
IFVLPVKVHYLLNNFSPIYPLKPLLICKVLYFFSKLISETTVNKEFFVVARESRSIVVLSVGLRNETQHP